MLTPGTPMISPHAIQPDGIGKELVLDLIHKHTTSMTDLFLYHVVLLFPASVCPYLCVVTKHRSHSDRGTHIHSLPLSSSCAFQGLKRGFGRVQAVGRWCSFDTQVSGTCWTFAALPIPPGEKKERAPRASCFPLWAHVAMRPWSAQWALVWFSFQQAYYWGLSQCCLIALAGLQ